MRTFPASNGTTLKFSRTILLNECVCGTAFHTLFPSSIVRSCGIPCFFWYLGILLHAKVPVWYSPRGIDTGTKLDTMQFVSLDGWLYANNVDLFTMVCDTVTDPGEGLLSAARDSRLTLDGSHSLPSQRSTLKDCISTLISRGFNVQLTVEKDALVGEVESDGEESAVFFGGEWSLRRLATLPTLPNHVNWFPKFDPTPSSGFAIRVRPTIRFPVTYPLNVPWFVVFETPSLCLRMAFATEAEICLYHNGIRRDHETLQGPAGGLHVSVSCWDEDFVVPCHVQGLDVLTRHLFNVQSARAFHKSRIIDNLLSRFLPWKEIVWDEFRIPATEYVSLLSLLEDNYVMFVSPKQLLNSIVKDQRVDTLTMIVSRRLFPSIGDKSGCLYDDMVDKFYIHATAALPISKEVFKRLVRLGWCKCNLAFTCCESGLLTRDQRRIMVFPYDVDATDVTVAMAELLKCDATVYERIEDWTLKPGVLNGQLFKECGSTDILHPFRMDVNTTSQSIQFVKESSERSRASSDAVSIDEISLEDVPFHSERRCHDLLKKLFPQLFQRISEDMTDALSEVRGRKLKHEWVMEDLDTGGDLSSLGMSILLMLILGVWHGAKVRIFVSAFHTAMVGVWMQDDYVLVDPSSSRENAVTLNFAEPVPFEVDIRKGTFIEVKCLRNWNVAVVERVIKHSDVKNATSLSVLILQTGKRKGVAMSSTRTWRLLSQCEHTDVEKVLHSLRKTSKSEEGESVRWTVERRKRRRQSE